MAVIHHSGPPPRVRPAGAHRADRAPLRHLQSRTYSVHPRGGTRLAISDARRSLGRCATGDTEGLCDDIGALMMTRARVHPCVECVMTVARGLACHRVVCVRLPAAAVRLWRRRCGCGSRGAVVPSAAVVTQLRRRGEGG